MTFSESMGPASVVAAALEEVSVAAARISDPTQRASAAEDAMHNARGLLDVLDAIRRQAVIEMKQQGASYGDIAKALGISRSRAQQLIEGR